MQSRFTVRGRSLIGVTRRKQDMRREGPRENIERKRRRRRRVKSRKENGIREVGVEVLIVRIRGQVGHGRGNTREVGREAGQPIDGIEGDHSSNFIKSFFVHVSVFFSLFKRQKDI